MMGIEQFINVDRILAVVDQLAREKINRMRVAQETPKAVEKEYAEWKRIVKEHPVQCAVVASGLLVALKLRLKPGTLATLGRPAVALAQAAQSANLLPG